MKKVCSLLLAVSVAATLLTAGSPALSAQAADNSNTLSLRIGSPLVLSGTAVKSLDSDNPDVVPIIRHDRTLVPLRAISEHFGAKVDYDADNRSASIQYEGHTYLFPIDRDSFSCDDEVFPLDSPSIIVEDRTMVPLRAICETVLSKTVSYHNNVISIGPQSVDLTDVKLYQAITQKIGQAIRPTDFAQVMAQLDNRVMVGGGAMTGGGGAVPNGGAIMDSGSGETPEMPEMGASESTSSKGAGGDYSSTNVQVDGVDESDIIKTDGSYLYVLSNGTICIVKVDGSDMKQVGGIAPDDGIDVDELFVDGDRLVALGTRYESRDRMDDAFVGCCWIGASFAYAAVYDISDRSAPKLLREVEAEGMLQTARKVDHVIYLVTNNYPNYYSPTRETTEADVLPKYLDTTVSAELQPIPLEHVMIHPGNSSTYRNFTTVLAFDMNDLQQPVSKETVLSGTDTVYMDQNSLYLASLQWNTEDEETITMGTNLISMTVNGTKLGYRAEGYVEGQLVNQFAMDEYEGNLRVAATVENYNYSGNGDTEMSNSLYVLDDDLNIIGSVTGLAKDERIYSVRFMGAKGFVVTFKETDPLFTFDLSDPKNPKLMGELKVPGFSDYLHPVGDHMMMGIGRDTYDLYRKDEDGKEEVISTRTGGIKVSLFDVSDFSNPKELDTIVYGEYATSTVLYNHKALLTDDDKGIYGFTAEVESDDKNFDGALLFQVSGNALSELTQLPADDYYMYDSRLCYIGSTLYYIDGEQIHAYQYGGSYQKLKDLQLSMG